MRRETHEDERTPDGQGSHTHIQTNPRGRRQCDGEQPRMKSAPPILAGAIRWCVICSARAEPAAARAVPPEVRAQAEARQAVRPARPAWLRALEPAARVRPAWLRALERVAAAQVLARAVPEVPLL